MVAVQQPGADDQRAITSAIDGGVVSIGGLIDEVARTKHDLRPFDESTSALCAALSSRLLAMREHPEAVALGFWIRPAAIARMRAEFEAAVPSDQLAVPRGLAFHVTPANVDTMFVYSWVLSLLVGNANIVRLSSRDSLVRQRILDAVAASLDDPAMAHQARRNRFVLTGHDEAALRALSEASDVRVVWGGNATVEHLRRFPIPARGRDVVFPDRHSLAVLDAGSVAALDEAELESLSDRFFDDAFWFDQGGCSSPRLVLWQATPDPDETERAVQRFREGVLGAIRRRRYKVETGMALNKMAFATEVAGRVGALHIESGSNEATWVRLAAISDYDRENCGGGLFFEIVGHDIESDLLTLIGPRDQTVTTFGLSRDVLMALARRANGRGVDRFVPVGRALAFDSTWDGAELLTEFSKRVVIEAQE